MAQASNPFEQQMDPFTLMREADLARRWQKSVRTLQRWRFQEIGPTYIRIGGTIFYRLGDVLAFEEAGRTGGGGE